MEKPLDFDHHHYSSPNFVRFINRILLGSDSLFEELEVLTRSISLVNVPTSIECISFRNLKLLKLSGIFFKTDLFHTIHLRFPLLTKFVSKNCYWFVQAPPIIVHAPLLQTISIQNDFDDFDAYYSSSIIFYSLLHLNEFIYCGYLLEDISLPSPCHASAKISLHGISQSDTSVFKFLRQFDRAKSIKFKASKVNILFKNEYLS